MKQIIVKSIGVEFFTNITTVTVDLVETNGRISKITDSVSIAIEGVYQTMNSELFDKITNELNSAGYPVATTSTTE